MLTDRPICRRRDYFPVGRALLNAQAIVAIANKAPFELSVAAMSSRVTENYEPYILEDLVQPHTLGRSFYMRPAQLPLARDKEYTANPEFWRDVLDERIGAERNVRLRGFNLFEWVPRNPGLFHQPEARWARQEAEDHVRSISSRDYREYLSVDGAPPDTATFRAVTSAESSARTLIYTPQGKLSMLRGGIGCVRYKPLSLKSGRTAWLMSATSTEAPDEGIPLLMDDSLYSFIVDALTDDGGIRCDVFGRTKFVLEEFSDLFSRRHGIPRLYIEVSEIRESTRIQKPGQVSVAASFLSSFEGKSKIYASYVTFDPGRRDARRNAAHWLKEEYVERLYEGSLLTDFDQRAPTFSDALFTLDQVLTSDDLADKIAKLQKLYGYFDWAQLKSFSYIEHQGDLIVTNNTITVTNSNNVVIQSKLDNAQLTVGAMPAGDDNQKQRLTALLEELRTALRTTPSDKTEQANALAEQAENLVKEAAKQQPNKTMLQVIGQGLKTTADFVKDAVPSVVTIVGQVVSLIGKIHGIPL